MPAPALTPDKTALLSRCAAVVARSPARTVVSGSTAALLHGLWLPREEWAAPVDVTVAAVERASRHVVRPRRAEVVPHRRALRESDVGLASGVPATTIVRTWRDLAGPLGLADLVAAGDSALRLGATVDELAEVCDRLRGQRGTRVSAAALPLLDARSRSRPESHLRVALVHPDLPRFEVNVAVFDDLGQWLAEPDLSLREARIALEYQGAEHAEVERMRRDMTRVAELRRAGWAVLLYGPAEVLRRPEMIAPEVRALILERAPHLILRGSPVRVVNPPPSGQ